jgi:dTDP-D-glucose 4,6-dehydratase
LETIKALLSSFGIDEKNIDQYVDFSCNRPGQDVRYALDDSKLRGIGWKPIKKFNKELMNIVKYYEDRFIW